MVKPALLCPSPLSASPGLTLRIPTTILRLPGMLHTAAGQAIFRQNLWLLPWTGCA